MRRSGSTGIAVQDMQKARERASEQLRTLLSRYDIAEFQAQKHAADMVDVLAGFARDPTLEVTFRRECAKDVMDRAYGTVGQKASFQLIDPGASDPQKPAAGTIGAQIEAAKVTAGQLEILSAYVGKVPVDQWPAEVREAAGDMLAVYAEDEATVDG